MQGVQVIAKALPDVAPDLSWSNLFGHSTVALTLNTFGDCRLG